MPLALAVDAQVQAGRLEGGLHRESAACNRARSGGLPASGRSTARQWGRSAPGDRAPTPNGWSRAACLTYTTPPCRWPGAAGAPANNLLLQLQADLLGIPVVRAKNPETTALGSAYLAGLAVGLYKSPDEIAAQWASDRTFEPQMAEGEKLRLRREWSEALGRANGWIDA
jgi:hypothetical protein